MRRILNGSVFLGSLLIGQMVFSQEVKHDWDEINKKVIAEHNVKGRTRNDIPDTKVMSNPQGGKVTNVSTMPDIQLAPGVTAKAYWGKGALMSFVTLKPNASV